MFFILLGAAFKGHNYWGQIIGISFIAIIWLNISMRKGPFLKATYEQRKQAMAAYGMPLYLSGLNLVFGIICFLVFYFLIFENDMWRSGFFAMLTVYIFAIALIAAHLKKLMRLTK